MARSLSCTHASPLNRSPRAPVLPAVLCALLTGCAGALPEEPGDATELESESSALRGRGGQGNGGQGNDDQDGDREGSNGLGTNGLGTNGLGTNGLGTNGLGTNGLSVSNLNSSAFVTWFNQHPDLSDMVMRYVVTCAAGAGTQLTWTNPVTNTAYTWNGSLGLTPGWAGGAPATEIEQQVITACLAAHTNKFGLQVPISLQGLDATGVPIPVADSEFTTYRQREACFFGNLFTGEGIFSANGSPWLSVLSSVRACGLQSAGSPDQCAPIQHVGSCSRLCAPDPQNKYFMSCTYNGKTYRAITTRIRAKDIYICGDGVCQVSESCGTGYTANNCRDCGPCP